MHVYQVCNLDGVGERIRGIYGILNVVNGKWYIGQSGDMRDRMHRHRYRLRTKTHKNEHLQASFDKHGEASFEYLIIERLPDELMNDRECFWIGYYRSHERTHGYNIETGGCSQRRLPEETRVKMAEAHKGKILPEETKKRISESKMGHPVTEETRKKLAEATKAHYASIRAEHVEKNESQKAHNNDSKGNHSITPSCPESHVPDRSPDPSLLPEHGLATADA